MRVSITPGKARGSLRVPASKSMAHRLLICAGLCCGESIIDGVSECEDVRATLDCLRALGADCRQEGERVILRGVSLQDTRATGVLPCRESGSTLRFLIPAALMTGAPTAFTGYGRLMERPMQIYEKLCTEKGLSYRKEGSTVTVCGRLPAGCYRLPGNVSSQFVSGLLFVLPLCQGESEIQLTTAVESCSYIDLTLDAMRRFGVLAEWVGDRRIRIPGSQRYQPSRVGVEGDYSNAAFPDAFNFLGGSVMLEGLREDSLQGDKCYRQAMQALDAGCATVDLQNCPDLGPILFALSAAKHGGVFTGTERLTIKESDRVAAMKQELAAFGITLIAEQDRATVLPGKLHPPIRLLSGHNDHRIVMSLAVLLTLVGGEIDGAEAVKKSYPCFFEDLKRLGIAVAEIEEESR